MAAKIKTWFAIGVGIGAPLFSILGTCGFFLCNRYPYRIDYIQEAYLERISILTLVSFLAGIFFGAIALRSFPQKRFFSGGLWLGISLTGLAALFYDPRIGVHSVLTAQNICINNTRRIEAAKEEWAQRTGATNGTEITWDDITPYFTNGSPKCPEGGTYNLGKVSEPVLCSIPNHRLPPQFQ